MNFTPDWFIADRVRRLNKLIRFLPRISQGIGRNRLLLDLKYYLDGPRHELPQLIDLLGTLGILSIHNTRVRLSRKGQRFATLNDANARQELAELIIQSGFLHTQVRFLHTQVQVSTINDYIRIPLSPLRRSAPQLLGLFHAWPGIVGTSFVELPQSLYLTLETPWSLTPLPTSDGGTRKAVGSRGEAYSYHYLRLQSTSPTAINWVALDDDGLGYDIEDRSIGFVRIEVKASQQAVVRFFFSENEYKVANHNPNTYQVHFWGGVNLNRDPNSEFAILRDQGFPIIFTDMAAHLEDGRLKAVPNGYRVTLGDTYFCADLTP